jgi:hypothetical protein
MGLSEASSLYAIVAVAPLYSFLAQSNPPERFGVGVIARRLK